MSILTDAYNLISAPNNPMNLNENDVFLHYIPEVLPDGTKMEDANVLVRITHIQNVHGNFSSNTSTTLSTAFQVQIWFPYNDPLADQYDELLNNYMEVNGYYPSDFSYITKDPDVDKLYLTSKFKKTNY
jgi:hypothetical protein